MENQDSVKDSVKFTRTKRKAMDIIHAAIGFDIGLDHFEEEKEEWGKVVQEWQDFRDALISDDGLTDLWKDKDFRMGVYRVAALIDLMIQIQFENPSLDNRGNTEYFCEELLSDSEMGGEGDMKSILKLIEALETIAQRATYHDIEEDVINDLRIALNTIVYAHQVLLKVTKEEKEGVILT